MEIPNENRGKIFYELLLMTFCSIDLSIISRFLLSYPAFSRFWGFLFGMTNKTNGSCAAILVAKKAILDLFIRKRNIKQPVDCVVLKGG
jgi:predicted transcriptional regulator with HTH domain